MSAIPDWPTALLVVGTLTVGPVALAVALGRLIDRYLGGPR